MDIETEPKEQQLDVTVLLESWLKSQSKVCELLVAVVKKLNELENKK